MPVFAEYILCVRRSLCVVGYFVVYLEYRNILYFVYIFFLSSEYGLKRRLEWVFASGDWDEYSMHAVTGESADGS